MINDRIDSRVKNQIYGRAHAKIYYQIENLILYQAWSLAFTLVCSSVSRQVWLQDLVKILEEG